MSKNIKIVRLITGEDLIGEVSVSEDIVEIKKPFIIYPTQQPRPVYYTHLTLPTKRIV